jgi:hypothetical protein
MKRKSVAAALLCLALVALMALAAGTATAGPPRCAPTLTFEGGLAGELDAGQYYFDTPAPGNLTVLHWRPYTWCVFTSGAASGEQWSYLWDWSMVLLDKPGETYPDDPLDVIPGWHYHWATGVICATDDPWNFWPSYWADSQSLPPKALWLWTTKGTGVTTPAGVHYITEYWTGHNEYEGKTAICTWTMADPDFQDARGKVWILK